jgi:GntR family transcriptional regulator
VLALTRTAYDTTGTPVETNDMVLVADRYELIYELPAD